MTGQKPLAQFKAGQAAAAVWENEINVNDQKKTVLKATIQRRFKDKDGNWKSSNSFGRNEIPLAIYCLEKAFDAIINEESNDDSSSE